MASSRVSTSIERPSPIAQQGVIPVPAGESKTAFIDARDIAEAAAAAVLEDGFNGRAWELTGPEALSYDEAAAILSEAGGRQIRYVDVDEKAFAQSLQDMGMTPEYAGLLVMLFQTVRAGVAANVTGDVHAWAGMAPRTLREYARDHREAFTG